MKKISFDFDNCLGHLKTVQDFCKELKLNPDLEIWIVTSRPKDPETYYKNLYGEETAARYADTLFWSNDEDLYPLAEEFGIPTERIVFTEKKLKSSWFINNNDFLFHVDDDHTEVMSINNLTKVKGINCLYPYWKQEAIKLLRNE